MQFDVVTIFPDYFDVLDLSLVGKARKKGLLNVNVHNLRDWAEDKHKTVDDTPYGGGPGMVMRPDIWGKALDEVMGEETPGANMKVLAIPTPSGEPLTQRVVEGLAHATDQIVFACGRYEGIDERVTTHYRQRTDVWVLEYSIGDYIVNGGEVAALTAIEAIGRLVEGVVGNDESIEDESFSDEGLLEAPIYTKPPSWRGLDVPAVLMEGNHGKINRWRRDQALERTLTRRPDMIRRLNGNDLDIADKEVLASNGVIVSPTYAHFSIRQADVSDAQEVAALAARLFPMACPAGLSKHFIARHIETEFSIERFTTMLSQPDKYRILLGYVSVGDRPRELVAYTLVENTPPDEVPQQALDGLVEPGTAYLSKCYVDKAWQGSGLSGVLMRAAMDDLHALAPEAPAIALCTHISNKRASKFYRRIGYKKVGRRPYNVGGEPMTDDVFVASFTTDKNTH